MKTRQDNLRAQFIREAITQARLQNNVVATNDAMRFTPGVGSTLLERIATTKRPSTARQIVRSNERPLLARATKRTRTSLLTYFQNEAAIAPWIQEQIRQAGQADGRFPLIRDRVDETLRTGALRGPNGLHKAAETVVEETRAEAALAGERLRHLYIENADVIAKAKGVSSTELLESIGNLGDTTPDHLEPLQVLMSDLPHHADLPDTLRDGLMRKQRQFQFAATNACVTEIGVSNQLSTLQANPAGQTHAIE